jgi:hypothetical protein
METIIEITDKNEILVGDVNNVESWEFVHL